MIELTVVSIIWALSFNIIGLYIAPFMDPYLAVLIRILCGLALFSLFIKPSSWRDKKNLMLIGAFQFGLTYLLLYQSYRFLTVIEILLFTITTPLFIIIINDLYEKQLNKKALIAALLAVFGAFIIRYQQISADFLIGFIILQCANFSFALGQLLYRHFNVQSRSYHRHNFFWFFVGALLLVFPTFIFLGETRITPSITLIGALLFVGFIATGLGQFLWCHGATKVSSAELSVMNNLVIPLGIIISLFFGGSINAPINFIIGSLIIILALIISRNKKQPR